MSMMSQQATCLSRREVRARAGKPAGQAGNTGYQHSQDAVFARLPGGESTSGRRRSTPFRNQTVHKMCNKNAQKTTNIQQLSNKDQPEMNEYTSINFHSPTLIQAILVTLAIIIFMVLLLFTAKYFGWCSVTTTTANTGIASGIRRFSSVRFARNWTGNDTRVHWTTPPGHAPRTMVHNPQLVISDTQNQPVDRAAQFVDQN